MLPHCTFIRVPIHTLVHLDGQLYLPLNIFSTHPLHDSLPVQFDAYPVSLSTRYGSCIPPPLKCPCTRCVYAFPLYALVVNLPTKHHILTVHSTLICHPPSAPPFPSR